MFTSCYTKNRVPENIEIKISPRYTRLVPVQVEKNGVIVNSSEFREFDFSKESVFQSSDFLLQNIMAVGATHMLRPVMMTTLSDMNVADRFENYTITPSNQPTNVQEA